MSEDPNRLTDGGDGTGSPPPTANPPSQWSIKEWEQGIGRKPYTEGEAIIQRPASRGSIILAPDGWFCPPLLCQRPTSLDSGRAAEQVVLANLTCAADLNIDGADGEVLPVCHYAVTEGFAQDVDTGEVKSFPRTSLILADGRVFQTTSEVVVRQLAHILRIYPDCPWNPPLLMEVNRKKSKRGPGYYHELRVVGR